jgi:hypothetical protein
VVCGTLACCLTETDDMVAEAHWRKYIVGGWNSFGFDKIHWPEVGHVQDCIPVKVSRRGMIMIECSVGRGAVGVTGSN